MKVSILKQIKGCYAVNSPLFWGEAPYTDMEGLKEVLLCAGMNQESLEILHFQKARLRQAGEFKKAKLYIPAFSLTTFNGSIGKNTANPTSLYGLDFDDGTSMYEAIQFFKDYGFVFYTSVSHTASHHKFRIIIELDMTVQNNDESHLVFNILKRRLEAAGMALDPACKDISRRFNCPTLSHSLDPALDGRMPICEAVNGSPYPIKEAFIGEQGRALEQARQDEAQAAAHKMLAFLSKGTKSTKREPYFNSLEDQNIINKSKIDEYLSLAPGNHHGKYFGLITHMKMRANARGHHIDNHLIFTALKAMDQVDGSWYSDDHRWKEIKSNKHQQII